MKMRHDQLKQIENIMKEIIDSNFKDSINHHISHPDFLRLQTELETAIETNTDQLNIELPKFDKDKLKYVKQKDSKSKDESNDLITAFSNYMNGLSELLGGTDDKHVEITRLIVTIITSDNLAVHYKDLRYLISKLNRDDVNDQTFLINASKLLLHVIDPYLNKVDNHDKIVAEVDKISKLIDPTTDTVTAEPLALSMKMEVVDFKKNNESKQVKKENVENKDEVYKERTLLLFLNTIGGEGLDHKSNESVLERAIEYYNEKGSKWSSHNRQIFEDLIKTLFDSYINPKILYQINHKGIDINIKDPDAQRLGQGLLALSRLEASDLYRSQVEKLIERSRVVGKELTKDSKNSGDSDKWVYSEMEPNDYAALERTRRITKIIMIPMLKDLSALDEKYSMPSSPKDKIKPEEKVKNSQQYQQIVESSDKELRENFSHHTPLYLEQSMFNIEGEKSDDKSKAFVQEMESVIHASLFAAYNKEKDTELMEFDDPTALAPVQAVDAVHRFIKKALSLDDADKNKPLDDLEREAYKK